MKRTAVWLVPDLIQGSGGHRTILQHANAMQLDGWSVSLFLEATTELRSETPAELINRLFGYSFDEVIVGWGDFPQADAYFATIWYSARVVRDIPHTGKKFYFVQDYEAYFNPMGDAFIQAENSYRYGLRSITIGNWLTYKLSTLFKSEVSSFDFCADLNIYNPTHIKRESKSICFVFQPEKPRRCTEIGIEALSIVKFHHPDTRIYLYGSDSKRKVPFEHERLGLLTLDECNNLYNRSTVGLCISSSNPSRVPFEMMAAGLPVVEVWRENNLYDFSDATVELCDPTPESIAKGIIGLLGDEKKRISMATAAIDFMQERGIEQGLQQFLETVNEVSAGQTYIGYCPEPSYHRPPVVDDHFRFSLPRELRKFHDLNWKTSMSKYLPPWAIRALRSMYHRLREAV